MKVYKCLKCGYELTSDTGIWHHIKKVHKTKPPIKKTVHYDLVDAADTQQIITPETKFIDVPIVLRVPLKLGDVEILLRTK